MPNYRRRFVAGGCYFFTVNLLDRRSSLLTDHIDALRHCVRRVRAALPFEIDAWVILPDHMHCLWRLPQGDSDYPARWRTLKTLFSKGLPPVQPRSEARIERGERAIWQRRYWEHTMRDEADYARHFDHVHFNPVKHGLAPTAAAWPFSTFHRAVQQGFYPPDWACDRDFSAGRFGDWADS